MNNCMWCSQYSRREDLRDSRKSRAVLPWCDCCQTQEWKNLFRKRRMKSNSSRESRSKKIRTEEKQACRSYSDQKAEMAKPIRSYWVALLGVPKVWSTLPVSVSSPELFNNFGTGSTSKYFGLSLTVKPTQCVSLIQLENCPAETHSTLQKWEVTDLKLESRPRPKLCHP